AIERNLTGRFVLHPTGAGLQNGPAVVGSEQLHSLVTRSRIGGIEPMGAIRVEVTDRGNIGPVFAENFFLLRSGIPTLEVSRSFKERREPAPGGKSITGRVICLRGEH